MNRKTKLLNSANKVLKIVSDISDVAVHLKKPTLIGVTLVVAKAIGSYQDLTEEASKDPFKDWELLDFDPLENTLFDILGKSGMLVTIENKGKKEGQGKAVYANIYGIEIGWVIYDSWKMGPRIPKDTDKEKLAQILAGLVWEKVSKNIKLTINPITKSFTLTEDVLTQSFPSKNSVDIYERLAKFVNKGFHRAALLDGGSGTGKSHIMRRVAKKFGGLTLRVSASDIGSASTLSKIIRILQPSALLIDDLCRAHANILNDFEEIKEAAPIILVSVNNIKRLDSATLRFGHFDEHFIIDKLDDEVLDRLLDGIPPNIASRLRVLTVTCIDEYRKLLEVYGEEGIETEKELERLEARDKLVKAQASEEKDSFRRSEADSSGEMTKKMVTG